MQIVEYNLETQELIFFTIDEKNQPIYELPLCTIVNELDVLSMVTHLCRKDWVQSQHINRFIELVKAIRNLKDQ